MAISADQFLDRLAERDLLDDKIIASLRKQVAAKSITSTQVAKTLIDKGHLTTFLAKKLLADDQEAGATAPPSSAPGSSAGGSPATSPSPALAPSTSPKTPSSPPPSSASAKTANDDLDFALSNEEVVDLIIVEDASEPAVPAAPKKPAASPPAAPLAAGPPAAGPPAAGPPVAAPPAARGGAPAPSAAPTALEPVDSGLTPIGRAPRETWRGAPPPSGSSPSGSAMGGAGSGYTTSGAATSGYTTSGAATSGYTTSGAATSGYTAGGYTSGLQPLGSPSTGPAAPLGPVDLLNDPLLTGAGGLTAAPAAPIEPKHKGVFVAKKQKAGRWESFWILGVGGLLIFAIVAGVFLFFVLKKGDATEMYQVGEDAYQSESYAQAIEGYRNFLKSFPDDPNASRARVRIGIATLRQAIGGARDFQRPLQVAGEVLPTIETEAAFDEGRAELATLLPDIAAGFAAQAQNAKTTADKQKYVDLAMKAMDLVNESKFITTRLREPQQPRIDGILEDVALVRREIQREKDLADTLAAMKAAIDKKEPSQAFELRRALLRKYAGLDAHPEMRKAVLAITDAERSLVRLVRQPIEPTAQEANAPSSQFVFSDHSGPGVTGVDGRVATVLAAGAVVGLDAPSGRVLWQRAVGQETSFQPQPLSVAAGADVLVADGARHELMRLGGLDGRVVWRLAIGEPFVEPVLHREKAFVATLSGQWWEVDVKTGASARRLGFPQPLAVGPAADDGRGVFYQLASHSNLYVLSQGGLACDDVIYLGHKAGTIAVPPLAVGGLLLVAVNSNAAGCELRVLGPDAKDETKMVEAQAPLRLDGHVLTPLMMYGSRVLVNTDRGSIRIFEVDPNRQDQPLTVTAKFDASTPERAIGYALAQEGRLWLADQRLARYDVQLTRGELSRKWVIDNRSVYIAPLRSFGQAIVHVRRRLGAPGVIVTAAHIEDGRALWETELGAPLAGAPLVDAAGQKLVAISSRGRLFEVAAADVATPPAITLRSPNKSIAPELGQVLERGVRLGPDRWAIVGGKHRAFAVYDFATGEFRNVMPKSAPRGPDQPGDAGGEPIAFAGAVLSPSKLGQVFLVDPASGADVTFCEPFQPALAASEEVTWSQPAAIGPNLEEFVIADSRQKLYRVRSTDQPARRLAEQAAVDVDRAIVSPLAAAQDTVYGAVRDVAFDRIIGYSLPDLKPAQEWELPGRVIAGPEAAGSNVLVLSDGGALACFGAGAQRLWQVAWPHGALAGPAAVAGETFWLATRNGKLVELSASDGAEQRVIDLAEPLGSGPVLFANRLLAAGAAGSLHVVDPARAASPASSATASGSERQ